MSSEATILIVDDEPDVDCVADGDARCKTAAIVVYGANAACQNSHIAAVGLKELGYSNVRVYASGKKDWTEAGLSVEKGSPVIA